MTKKPQENDSVSIVQAPAHVAPTAEILIAQALDKGLSVETIERLLAMRKELKAEAAKEAYDEAMANFQAECPVIEKDKKVNFITKAGDRVDYAYAPLDSIVRQVKELIAKNGFSYNFKTEESAEGVRTVCIVKHKLGHTDSSDFMVTGGGTSLMSAAQIKSSKATYAKRNAFCNAFGIITGDEDNDAPKTKEEAKAETQATAEQRAEIEKLTVEAGLTTSDVATRCRQDFGVSITEITGVQAQGLIDRLNIRIKKMKSGT